MAVAYSSNDEVNTAPRKWLGWRMIGPDVSPQVTNTPAPSSLVPTVAEPAVYTVSRWLEEPGLKVRACFPSGTPFTVPSVPRGHSRSGLGASFVLFW